ncbi:hypothetical protein OAF42_04455 [Planctomicrobium sp.]|nr:hypothetical protein [Planctomicrobium sp.]MDB4731469.1 hypothetical protein [bacterium]MDB4733678.1 hypothetical protein [Planctomicrobium sp.]
MKKIQNLNLLLCSAMLLMFVANGCAEKADPAPQEESEAETVTETVETEEGGGEAVTELTAEEVALVAEQVFCPVGGELGGMGTPVKVMVEGKPIFICCEGCRGPLLEDPEKYLAKLEEKKQKAAAEAEEASEEASSEDTES